MATQKPQVVEVKGKDLEEMWRRYEFIVNTSKEFMALINAEYVYEAVNNAFCRSHSRTRSEIIGTTIANLWGEDIFQQVIKEPIERCFAGEEVSYLAWYEHAALGLRCMDVTYYPYCDAGNEVTHAVVVSRDVTERELAKQSMHRYAERLETMHEVDRAVMSARSPELIADSALRHLQKLVPCTRASIVMFEERPASPGRFSTVEEDENSGAARQQTGRLVEIGSVRVLAQLGDVLLSSTNSDQEHLISIPLVAQHQLLGALSLRSDQSEGFLDEHRDIAREVAYPVALAIQRAQLRHALQRYTVELESLVAERTREAERRRRVAEGLRDIVTILNSSRPLEEMLEYIVSQGALLLRADGIVVLDFAETESELSLRVARSLTTDHQSAFDRITDRVVGERALAAEQPIAIPDVVAYLAADDSLAEQERGESPHYSSILAVPLSGADRHFGVLMLKYMTVKEFTDEDIHLATTLADQVVLATENARLHHRAEEAAVMEERERLARELHDSVTQLLYSLTLFAEAGRRQSDVGNTPQVESYLEQIGDTAQQALKEMRLLLYELRPLVLEQEGLLGALRRRLDAVERRAGIEVYLCLSDSPRILEPEVEEGLYRIAQEALNNALKHADSRDIQVNLKIEEENVELDVVDSGGGFDVDQGFSGGGMGLINMRDRAEKLGGNLSIVSSEGEGTRIHVVIRGNQVAT